MDQTQMHVLDWAIAARRKDHRFVSQVRQPTTAKPAQSNDGGPSFFGQPYRLQDIWGVTGPADRDHHVILFDQRPQLQGKDRGVAGIVGESRDKRRIVRQAEGTQAISVIAPYI